MNKNNCSKSDSLVCLGQVRQQPALNYKKMIRLTMSKQKENKNLVKNSCIEKKQTI